MNKKFAALTAVIAITVTSALAGTKNPIVGGQEMYPTKNIVENAVNSADHTTLVAAVKAAGLIETLEGPGPFIVFAPTNKAFAKLPAGTVDTLLRPEKQSHLGQGAHLSGGFGEAERLRFEKANQSGPRQCGTHNCAGRQAVGITARWQPHHLER